MWILQKIRAATGAIPSFGAVLQHTKLSFLQDSSASCLWELKGCKSPGPLYLQIHPSVERLNVRGHLITQINTNSKWSQPSHVPNSHCELWAWLVPPYWKEEHVIRKKKKKANQEFFVLLKLLSGHFYESKVFCQGYFGKLLNKESHRAFNRPFLCSH